MKSLFTASRIQYNAKHAGDDKPIVQISRCCSISIIQKTQITTVKWRGSSLHPINVYIGFIHSQFNNNKVKT